MIKVKMSKLTGAKYNPKSRVAGGHLRQLKNSIERVGLIYPIAVTKDSKIIDGHRRVQACKLLGWDQIPAIVFDSEESAETLYAEINANSRNLSGTQNLQVWLTEPTAVTSNAARMFDKYQEVYGLTILRRLIQNNMSISVLRVANKVSIYLDTENRRQIASWLIKHRNSQIVRAYIRMMQPPKILLRAISQDRPLRVVYRS